MRLCLKLRYSEYTGSNRARTGVRCGKFRKRLRSRSYVSNLPPAEAMILVLSLFASTDSFTRMSDGNFDPNTPKGTVQHRSSSSCAQYTQTTGVSLLTPLCNSEALLHDV